MKPTEWIFFAQVLKVLTNTMRLHIMRLGKWHMAWLDRENTLSFPLSDPSSHTKQKQKHASKYQRNSWVSFYNPLIIPHVYVHMIYFSKYDCNYKRQTQILTYFTYIRSSLYFLLQNWSETEWWFLNDFQSERSNQMFLGAVEWELDTFHWSH